MEEPPSFPSSVLCLGCYEHKLQSQRWALPHPRCLSPSSHRHRGLRSEAAPVFKGIGHWVVWALFLELFLLSFPAVSHWELLQERCEHCGCAVLCHAVLRRAVLCCAGLMLLLTRCSVGWHHVRMAQCTMWGCSCTLGTPRLRIGLWWPLPRPSLCFRQLPLPSALRRSLVTVCLSQLKCNWE